MRLGGAQAWARFFGELLDTLVGREPALVGEADYQAFRERVGRIAEAADRLEQP